MLITIIIIIITIIVVTIIMFGAIMIVMAILAGAAEAERSRVPGAPAAVCARLGARKGAACLTPLQRLCVPALPRARWRAPLCHARPRGRVLLVPLGPLRAPASAHARLLASTRRVSLPALLKFRERLPRALEGAPGVARALATARRFFPARPQARAAGFATPE